MYDALLVKRFGPVSAGCVCCRCALTANVELQDLKEKSTGLVHPAVLEEEEEEGGGGSSSPPHPRQLTSVPPVPPAAAAATDAIHSPRAGLSSADQSNPSSFKQPLPRVSIVLISYGQRSR